MSYTWLIWLTWATPMAAAAAGLLSKKAAPFLSMGSIFVSLAVSVASFAISSMPYTVSAPWFYLLGSGIRFSMLVDGLSAVMGSVVAFVSFLISVYSYKYMENDWGWTRYWFFFTFFVGSMLLLVFAGNLVVMLVGWEGTTLASYALIGHWYTDEEERWVGDPGRKALGVQMWSTPSQAGVRAMVFTSLADVGFIVGIGMLYYASHTLSLLSIERNMGTIIQVLNSKGMLLPFLIAFTMGAFGKSAQFPFHEWLVTAMTGPTSISALIHAATMVNAGVYFLLRFAPMIIVASAAVGAYSAVSSFFTYVLIIGALTAFMMASMAITSNELKLILAYSTSSQLGYMFMGIGAAYFAVPSIALFASMSHLISQALFKAAMFMAAGVLIHEYSSRYIKDMKGAWNEMKITGIAFALAALSLAGIPPLSGFWDKDLILEVTLESGNIVAYVLGALGAFLTAFYIFRAFSIVFSGKPEKEVKEGSPIEWVPYLLLSLATLLFGVFWYYPNGGLSSYIYSVISTRSIVVLPTEAITFNPADVALSVGISLVGLGLALGIYLKRRELALKSGALIALRNFLYDRWLINAIYYRVFVNGLQWIAGGLRSYIEFGAFDRFYHVYVPRAITWVADKLRGYQKGEISRLLITMLFGALIMALFVLIVMVM